MHARLGMIDFMLVLSGPVSPAKNASFTVKPAELSSSPRPTNNAGELLFSPLLSVVVAAEAEAEVEANGPSSALKDTALTTNVCS